MAAAPIPGNEAERLEALRGYAILDTAAEQSYDDITRLASYICETPIALLSFVDGERQWFKSRVGWQARETPREQSLCAHAILQPDQLLVVNDATLDQRFADNPLVTDEPGIRCYAGAPLVTPGGFPLGTLCIIDRTPRELSPDLREALQALARQAMERLELRRTVAGLERDVQELQSREWRVVDERRQLEAANSELVELVTTDGLTGVLNRAAFERALLEELARAQRQGTPVSLLLVDIDRFRAFNNLFGHGGGDKVLRAVAGLMTTHTRPFDVIARYEGGEFALILSSTDEDAALLVGERLRRAVQSAPWRQQPITVSIGASTTAGDVEGAAFVAEAADALQHAKRGGRDIVRHAARYR